MACAAVLAKLYDLKLPPRKVAVRKRKARSPEDEAAAEAELRLQKAKKAEAAAEAAHVAAATRCDGVRRRVDALGPAPDIFAMMERQNRDEDPPSRQECVEQLTGTSTSLRRRCCGSKRPRVTCSPRPRAHSRQQGGQRRSQRQR